MPWWVVGLWVSVVAAVYGLKATDSDKHRIKINRNNNMNKKIKQKLCELVCKIFGITQCLCSHECNCKKEKK